MNNKSKLLLVLLAALILYYFVSIEQVFNTVSFNKGLEKINKLDKEFELNKDLVPQNKLELKKYNLELINLEKEFSEKKQDDNSKALNLLIKSKKEFVLMQLNLIKLKEAISCQEQIDAINSVISSAESARESIQEYLDKYHQLSEKTTKWNENILDTTSSTILSFREIKDTKASC